MSNDYRRASERKLCYFIKDYVEVTLVIHRWRVTENAWEEEEVAIECPRARKCRRAEYDCMAIYPDSGRDPFVPPRDLLADMW